MKTITTEHKNRMMAFIICLLCLLKHNGFAVQGYYLANIANNINATIFITLISGLIAGPAVSL